MASIERTAYPVLPITPDAVELRSRYTPKRDEVQHAREYLKSERLWLNYLVLLKTFQQLGYFVPLSHVPPFIIDHIRDWLIQSGLMAAPEQATLQKTTPETYRAHPSNILAWLQVRRYKKRVVEPRLREALVQATSTQHSTQDLINYALEWLVKESYELPAFWTLDRIASSINTTSNNAIFARVESALKGSPNAMIATLNELMQPGPNGENADWLKLKAYPANPTLTHLENHREHLTWLMGLGSPAPYLQDISVPKLRYFAEEARDLSASDLMGYGNLARCHTIMLAAIWQTQKTAVDDMADMLCRRMSKIENQAKTDLVDMLAGQRSLAERLVRGFRDVLVALRLRRLLDIARKVKNLVFGFGGRETVIAECDAFLAYENNNHLPFMWRHFKSNRSVAFGVINALKLKSTSPDLSMIKAIEFVMAHQLDGARTTLLPYEISLDWADAKWQRFVKTEGDEHGEIWLKKNELELCVFVHLVRELRNGDIAIEGGDHYADHREQLLPWVQCMPKLIDYSEATGFPAEANGFVDYLQTQFVETTRKADAFLSLNPLKTNEKGELVLSRYKTQIVSKEFLKLEQEVLKRLPSRTLIEALVNAHRACAFTRHFGPKKGTAPKISEPVTKHLVTTFAYSTHLGPTQVATHLRGNFDARELRYINRHHMTADRLYLATRDVINHYNRIPIGALWGTGMHSGADGTHIEIYQGNKFSEHHIRYGKPGGIAYHYVSDKYVVLFTTFIPCSAWEGVYILDLFQKNTSEIQPKTIHADTQGQSATIFGLSYLLGARLMPRIRNWRDLILFRPNNHERYHYLGQMFKGTIDWEIIRTHWQEMMQIVLSIQAGKLWPSTLLKKLSSYSHKNKLYLAFRELGRVIRTMFILDYLTSTDMQRDIQRMTNKVEGFNRFNEWFVIGSRGVITDNNPDEFDKRMKYRDLMANCVIWQTAIDLTRTVQEIAATGKWKITLDDLEILSPYITRHYKRFGEFVIELDKAMTVNEAELKLPDSIQRAPKPVMGASSFYNDAAEEVEDSRFIDDEEW